MDVTLSETQRDLVSLAGRILDDAAGRSTPPAQLWRLLGGAGLLSVALPEHLGGLGLGFVELGLVLESVGRTAASVPLLETGVAATVFRQAEGGSAWDDLRRRMATGDAVVGLALDEPTGNPFPPFVIPDGQPGRWALHGTRLCASSDPPVTHLLLSAPLAGVGRRLLVLDVNRDGVRLGSGTVTFDRVTVGPDDVLEHSAGEDAVPFAARCATAAACSVMAGAAAEALRLTADYVRTREQFDRPLGSFQAVGQRAADAFTAAWSIELTARQACWQLDCGAGPEVAQAVAVAKYTAATAGTEVVRAAHHLHGGIGLDRDYPLHRHTMLLKRLELLLGGGSEQAALLGDLLAATAVPAAAPARSA